MGSASFLRMNMAAAIPTCAGADADSGGHGPIAASPGADISVPGSEQAAASAGSGSTRSWSSFLEALGVARTNASEVSGTTVLTSSSSSPQPGIAGNHGASLNARVVLSAPGKGPGPSEAPLPVGTPGSENFSRARGIKATANHEKRLKDGDGTDPKFRAAGVAGDASTIIAAIAPPISALGQSPREKCAIRTGHLIGGPPKDEHGFADRREIGEVLLHGQTSDFEAKSQPVEGRAYDVTLPMQNNIEQSATAGMDGKGSGTETVGMPPPVEEKEARTLSESTGLVDSPVAAVDTYPSRRFAARKADAVEATSANSTLKSARPSDTASGHGSRSGRLELASDALNQGSPIAAVQQQWNNVAPSHTPNEFNGVGYRPGNNLNGMHPAGSVAGDTFAAIDAERTASPATWIHAGTHRAEAGYLDPALGWVGVRADAVGNGVHAALLPGSGEAAQVLGSHLAGLNTYLSEHHGQSATVTLGAREDAMAWTGSGTGAQTGQDHHARGDTNQGREEWPGKHVVPGSEPEGRERSHAPAAATTGIAKRAGEYISVMA